MALYGLCVLFRRNALVINSGRPWTTLKHTENLTQGVFTEVCETILLYLGNNLYAVLCRLPFSLDQPSPTDLEDIHQMQPLTITNSPERWMYIEGRINSLFEQSLRDEEIVWDEEIEELPEQKPELLPTVGPIDILHPHYIPPGIKQEVVDAQYDTSDIRGTEINLPGPLAKDAKQEMLDTTLQDIAVHHSESCAITMYLKSKKKENTLGLQIENVYTVEPEHITSKPVKKRWSHILFRQVDEVQEPENTPSVATTATAPTTLKSTAALPEITELLSITQPTTSQYCAANMSTIVSQPQPLSVVTMTQNKTATEITPTLPMVTSTPCQLPVPAIDPLPMVTSSVIITDKTTGSSQILTVQES